MTESGTPAAVASSLREPLAAALTLAFAGLLAGCFTAKEPDAGAGDDGAAGASCAEAEQPDNGAAFAASCTPAYEPSFANVFAKTLQPSCGKSGGTCHGSEGNMAGLTFIDEAASFALLTQGGWVIGSDAACSPLLHVLRSQVPMERMPPAGLLPEAERCSVAQWIAAGAPR